MRYSLANYIVTIKPNENDTNLKAAFGDAISVGGSGSNVGQISVSRDKSLFGIKSYATGGWAVDKDLSKTGKVSIKLHQLSPQVQRFINLCNMYYEEDYEGCTITVEGAGKTVATCTNCFINQTGQNYGESSEEQTWEFLCGTVDFVVQE